MRDLAHSGISIFVNDYDGDSASITVEIDNSAKKPPVNAEFIPGNVTAEYINDVSGVLVGTLIAECELAAPADISLEDPATGAKIPLVTELTANSRELSLYVDAEHIDKLKANTQYDLNLESRVFTYFGGAVSIKDFDNRISLPQIPYPMVKAASFDHICSHNYELGRSPDLFNPDSTQISFFCHSDNCLWLNLFDISTNEVRNLELEMPSYQDKSLSPEKVLMIDNAYYLVVFKMRNSRFMSHAVLYDLQGDLLDDYVFESSIIYVGLHGSAVFLDENADKFLEITVKDRQITLTDLNTLANTRGMYKRIGAYKVTSTDLALFEDTMELDLLRVVETSSGTVLYERKLDTGMDTVYLDIVSHNGKLYVAMLGDTIRLITLNNKYELIKEENLLANHGATFYDKIYFDFTEEGSWLTFDAVASTNAISYSSTFLLTLSETGDVENYYRYGDASFRFCGNVIYLGDGKFFLVGEMNEYFLLSKDERIASQRHKWKAADCTKPKTCTVCGATEGKPVGHIYNNGVDGTCNVCSIHRETTEDRTVMHMFRMYDPNSGEHFYTGSEVERDNLVAEGWNYEGVGFTFSMTTGMPVYRLYDPINGEHLYTMNAEEKAMLMAQGWNFEGIAFNSAYDTEVPQYRLHNPNETRGAYHFTASIEERDYLLSLGWEDQGIGFYSSWK